MMQTIYLKLNEALNATNTYSALYQVYGQSDEQSQEGYRKWWLGCL
jgi:hypothetical protein